MSYHQFVFRFINCIQYWFKLIICCFKGIEELVVYDIYSDEKFTNHTNSKTTSSDSKSQEELYHRIIIPTIHFRKVKLGLSLHHFVMQKNIQDSLNSLQNMIQNVNCHLPIKQSENP
jgi:hypothetical protein